MLLLSLLALQEVQEPHAFRLGDTGMRWSGELMGRAEFRDPESLAVDDGPSGDAFRARGAFGLHWDRGEYVGGFAEVLGSWGDGEDHESGGLQHLYADLRGALGSWDLRVGRAEMELGDGRLVSASRSWLFEPNAFDMVRVSGESFRPMFRWQAWASTAAAGPADVEDDFFAGAFADWGIGRDDAAELYLLFRRQADLDIVEVTLAARWHGQTWAGLDWSLFGALQDGDQVMDRETWAQAFVLTLHKELDTGDHVGFEFGLAKGNDDSPDDFKRFTPVYMDAHRYNGRADLFAFSNLVDASLQYWRDWTERWSVHADWHSFWRHSRLDDVFLPYTLEPYGLTNFSTSLGHELDLYAEGRLADKLRLDAGVALFLAGSALPGDEQLWFFASATYEL